MLALGRAVAGAAAWMLAVAPALADRPAPNPNLYQNLDYQLSVRLPRKLPACVGDFTNHGVVILLEAGAQCDGPYDAIRHISVSANYNTAEIGNTAAALAAVECRWDHAGDIVWLKDQMLDGRRAAGCRRRFGDGHIAMTLIALRRTGENPLTWIEISADLLTTPAHYAADIRIFDEVLRGVWIHPDGPDY